MTIVVRTFANLDELSKIVQASGIPCRYGMSNFAEQFNVTRGEFDFVDVGPGKGNAARKLASKFHGLFIFHVHLLTFHRQS